MDRTLIVARIALNAEREVAAIFGESDERGELPQIAGVARRSLYRLDDVYVHVLDTERAGPDAVKSARTHAEFGRISRALEGLISPYLSSWTSPTDAIAHCFYDWQRPESGR